MITVCYGPYFWKMIKEFAISYVIFFKKIFILKIFGRMRPWPSLFVFCLWLSMIFFTSSYLWTKWQHVKSDWWWWHLMIHLWLASIDITGYIVSQRKIWGSAASTVWKAINSFHLLCQKLFLLFLNCKNISNTFIIANRAL